MRFVIDESTVKFDGQDFLSAIDKFEDMLDRVDQIIERKHRVAYSADLFANPVLNEKSLYELYDTGSAVGIPREVQERIAAVFGVIPKWDELSEELPAALDVCVADEADCYAPSVAWVHAEAARANDKRSAVIVYPGTRAEGSFAVSCANTTLPIWFYSSIKGYRNFCRWTICFDTATPAEFEYLAGDAFPNIEILEGACSGIKDMSKPYGELCTELVSCLSVLSDCGQAIFAGRWQEAPARFGSLGVNISDENGNTKSNRGAERARTRSKNGNKFIFWWHMKLRPDRDRVHLFPDPVLKGEKVIVGIFCRHLPT
jgi:hypothetical protein